MKLGKVVAKLLAAAGVIAVIGQLANAADAKSTRPNVVVIVADDLGDGDLSIQGGKDIPTPNIDSIARNGTRFTNGYVTCPVCSPTRAGLLTGRYQERFGHEFNPGPAAAENFGLAKDQPTVAEAFKSAGYRTALIGKWHEGNKPGFRPTDRGFDEFFGFLGGAHAYLPPNLLKGQDADDPDDVPPAQAAAARQQQRAPIFRNEKVIDEQRYLTEAFAQEAVSFIERNQKQPFFAYLAYNAVHLPAHATQKYLDRFPKLEGQRKVYAAQLSALDDAVGEVLAKIREAGLEERTLIVFFSDNGGPVANGSNNGIFNGHKATVYEGGIRVPFFVQWKGTLPTGAVREDLVASIDVFPTALAATGMSVPSGAKFDGVNLLPVLRNESSAAAHDALFWRFGPQWAVRQGKWKLGSYPGRKVQLFDLARDPGEQADVSAQNAAVVAELKAQWEAWNQDNQAPKWNPGGRGAGAVAANATGEAQPAAANPRAARRAARRAANTGAQVKPDAASAQPAAK